jgi:hypothetical protein
MDFHAVMFGYWVKIVTWGHRVVDSAFEEFYTDEDWVFIFVNDVDRNGMPGTGIFFA